MSKDKLAESLGILMTFEEYVKNDGKLCPLCRSDKVELSANPGLKRCRICRKRFSDVRSLVGYCVES